MANAIFKTCGSSTRPDITISVSKIVQSSKAEKVLPALGEIYDTYGNPRNQLSDNSPPLNSKAMEQFAQKRDIIVEKKLHHYIYSLILLKRL